MKLLIKNSLIVIISFVFTAFIGYNQSECRDFFSEGSTITYSDNSKGYGGIAIKGGCFIENFEDDKTIIKSEFIWTSDCSFILTIVKIKGDAGQLKKGMQIEIIVTHIDGDKAYYKFKGREDNIDRYYIKLN